jgi:hypothetical protein
MSTQLSLAANATFMKWAKRIGIRVAVVLVLGIALRLSGVVEGFAFYLPGNHTGDAPPGIEDVTIAIEGGQTLHAWFIPATDAGAGEKRPAILHVHGNAGTVKDHLAFSQHLADAGFHVLLFDYRGYGKSSPARFLRRAGLMQDTRAAWDAMLARPDVDSSRSGVFGVSLGGAFAVQLAVERQSQVRALCTVSAFRSYQAIAHDKVPLLGPLLVAHSLSAEANAPKVQVPWLLVHGQNDEIIPVQHASTLHALAPGSRLELVPSADHNGVMEFEQSTRASVEFFRAALQTR